MESMNTLRYNCRREKLKHRYIRCRSQRFSARLFQANQTKYKVTGFGIFF